MIVLNPNLTWPIGIIMWTEFSDNPSKYFGGTWIKLTDVYPYASDNLIGSEIGSNSEILSIDKIPEHIHRQVGNTLPNGNGYVGIQMKYMTSVNTANTTPVDSNEKAGGGQAHNNMPKSRKMFCWKRTA